MFGRRTETVEGLNKLVKDIGKLEKIPQSQITKGVRRGTKIILQEARNNAPTKTGKMKKKITIKPERSKKGKKVMQVTFQKIDKFPEAVKISKDGKRYYYPASQNYGFKARNGRKIPGKYFLERALRSKEAEAAKIIVDEIGNEIEKSIMEGKIR